MSQAIAEQAATLWGIEPHALQLVARRENTVYRAETPEGPRALRLHRPGYRSLAELVSEMEWMEALTTAGMQVPRPSTSLGGQWIEMVGETPVSVLSWLSGARAGAGGRLDVADRTGFAADLGRTMARLHDASDSWAKPATFTRPRWDIDGLLGDAPIWGRFWDNPDLTPEERDTLLSVRVKAYEHLTTIAPNLDFGLLHADILTENILMDQDRTQLIDFDDGGWGFRDFELATFLMRFLEAPDFPALKAAMIEGYAERRAIAPQTLDFFILLRALTYPGWIIPRRHEPGGAARSEQAIRTALPLARNFLSGAALC